MSILRTFLCSVDGCCCSSQSPSLWVNSQIEIFHRRRYRSANGRAWITKTKTNLKVLGGPVLETLCSPATVTRPPTRIRPTISKLFGIIPWQYPTKIGPLKPHIFDRFIPKVSWYSCTWLGIWYCLWLLNYATFTERHRSCRSSHSEPWMHSFVRAGGRKVGGGSGGSGGSERGPLLLPTHSISSDWLPPTAARG